MLTASFYGYYQPAGPLISAGHHAVGPGPTAKPPPPAALPPTPTPPPPAAAAASSASNREESPESEVTVVGGELMAQQYRYQPVVAPGQQFGYSYAPQYYPSPPASSLQYPHYHQEICYPAPPPYFHKSPAYTTPPPAVAVPPQLAAAAAAAQRYHRGYAQPPPSAPGYDQPGQVVPATAASGSYGPTAPDSAPYPSAPTATPGSAGGPPPPAPPPSQVPSGGAGPPTVVDAYPPPPPPPAAYYGYAQPPGGPPPPACYTHSPTRSLAYIEYQSCPCPMQSCPKNVHTGPLTGDSSKGPAKPPAPALAPPPLPLPLEPAPCPPSPARGSAGAAQPPATDHRLHADRPHQQGSPAALPHAGAARETSTATVLAVETKPEVKCEAATSPAAASAAPEATPAPAEAAAPRKRRASSATADVPTCGDTAAPEIKRQRPESPAPPVSELPPPAAQQSQPLPDTPPPSSVEEPEQVEADTAQQPPAVAAAPKPAKRRRLQQAEQQTQAKVYPHRRKPQLTKCINNNCFTDTPVSHAKPATPTVESTTDGTCATATCTKTVGRKGQVKPVPKTLTTAVKQQQQQQKQPQQLQKQQQQKKQQQQEASQPKRRQTAITATAPTQAAARRLVRATSGPRRGLSGPRWSNGWSWEGTAFEAKVFLTSDDTPVTRRCYPGMRHREGDLVCPHDCILLKSGPRKLDLPFVAKVAALWENPDDGEMMMSLLWYYRPEHTEQGSTVADTEDEIFASKHKDINSVACIEDKCYVLTFSEYCRYRKAARRQEEGLREPPVVVPPPEDNPRRRFQPPASVSPELVFYCRRVYDFRQKRVLSSRSQGGSRYGRQLGRNRSRLL